MGKGNRTTLSNIKKVELIDKDYRTIGVLPFENLTGNDYYSYIGKTVQKFVSNDLLVLDQIKISTNDYLIPEQLDAATMSTTLSTNIMNMTNVIIMTNIINMTNMRIIFSYGTNLLLKVIILKPDTV